MRKVLAKHAERKAIFERLLLDESACPTASVLAKEAKCSQRTATRFIAAYREEHPEVSYDEAAHRFCFKDRPLSNEDLTMFLMAFRIVAGARAKSIYPRLQRVWDELAKLNPAVDSVAKSVLDVFWADMTAEQKIEGKVIVQYVIDASRNTPLCVVYRSPWTGERKIHHGRIVNVRISDGATYLLFLESDGETKTLNAAFVESVECDQTVTFKKDVSSREAQYEWCRGFGIWSGKLRNIEIHISAKAARYYEKQQWHPAQKDRIRKDGTLVRRFNSAIAPQLVHRVLSLGKRVTKICPKALRELVRKEAESLMKVSG